MQYGEEQKILTAERLKEERESKGLSHERLSQILNEKYGNGEKIISTGVLKNYEVADEYHSKFTTGFGMNVKYLGMFADFYNVSADYLLGLTDIKAPDTTTQAICEATGLSEEAVNHLITNKALVDRIRMNFEEREIKILTDTNKANDFISRLIISKSISSISYKLKEVQLERAKTKERQEDINRKRKEIFIKLQTATDELRDDLIEDEMELLYGPKEIASEYNETATVNRMITADDYEGYLLNDITTTFRKLIEDILNEEAGASCDTPIP